MCGWLALLGVGAFVLSFEQRWSGWKVGLESIVIWIILFLIAAITNTAQKQRFINWPEIS
jgi:hypothetical protein